MKGKAGVCDRGAEQGEGAGVEDGAEAGGGGDGEQVAHGGEAPVLQREAERDAGE